MKTRHIFLIISILMIIIEALMGYLAFELVIDVTTRIILALMMLIGITVAILMYTMYKTEKQIEYDTYKSTL